jgi:FkbM family methyltransferase
MSNKNFFELVKELKTPEPRGIMQIGASYGQEIDLFKNNNVHACVMVEPLRQPFDYISAICQQNSGYVAVNALCSDFANEKVNFHVASNGGQSSSLLKPDNHLKVFDFVKFEKNIQLETTTVDVIYEYLIRNEVYSQIVPKLDSLYIDVQGAEYKVLLGAIKFLKKINYIYFELIRGDLYEGVVDLVTYIVFLKSQGFVINNLNFNQYHHSDVLFVRESLLNIPEVN